MGLSAPICVPLAHWALRATPPGTNAARRQPLRNSSSTYTLKTAKARGKELAACKTLAISANTVNCAG